MAKRRIKSYLRKTRRGRKRVKSHMRHYKSTPRKKKKEKEEEDPEFEETMRREEEEKQRQEFAEKWRY